jgi:hypothetical protein
MTYALLTAMATNNRIATSEPVFTARHEDRLARNRIIRYSLNKLLTVLVRQARNVLTETANLFRLPLCLTNVVK